MIAIFLPEFKAGIAGLGAGALAGTSEAQALVIYLREYIRIACRFVSSANTARAQLSVCF